MALGYDDKGQPTGIKTPGQQSPLEELDKRIAALEKKQITTEDLPMRQLQAKLQANWQPEGDALIYQAPNAQHTIALAVPVMVAESGGTIPGGTGSLNWVTNMDSAPKSPLLLGNFTHSWYRPDSLFDGAPVGFQTEWCLKGFAMSNGTNPGNNGTWGMWEHSGVGGGAGGYTDTMVGGFRTPNAVVSLAAGGFYNIDTGWSPTMLEFAKRYFFGFFNSNTLAANSMLRWRVGLHRRFTRLP